MCETFSFQIQPVTAAPSAQAATSPIALDLAKSLIDPTVPVSDQPTQLRSQKLGSEGCCRVLLVQILHGSSSTYCLCKAERGEGESKKKGLLRLKHFHPRVATLW